MADKPYFNVIQPCQTWRSFPHFAFQKNLFCHSHSHYLSGYVDSVKAAAGFHAGWNPWWAWVTPSGNSSSHSSLHSALLRGMDSVQLRHQMQHDEAKLLQKVQWLSWAFLNKKHCTLSYHKAAFAHRQQPAPGKALLWHNCCCVPAPRAMPAVGTVRRHTCWHLAWGTY